MAFLSDQDRIIMEEYYYFEQVLQFETSLLPGIILITTMGTSARFNRVNTRLTFRKQMQLNKRQGSRYLTTFSMSRQLFTSPFHMVPVRPRMSLQAFRGSTLSNKGDHDVDVELGLLNLGQSTASSAESQCEWKHYFYINYRLENC